MKTLYLEPNQIPAQLRGSYSGKQFKAIVTESVTIPIYAGLWSGGSRDTYRVVRLSDGATIEPVRHNAAPWDSGRAERKVDLEPGIAVVEHSIFCGKDAGLTFYVHPANATALLPPVVNLSDIQRKVLNVHGGIKSAYRKQELAYQKVSESDYETAKAFLIAEGYLNKAGAITTKGRNAR